jgi:SAM-dependent methyltransferase
MTRINHSELEILPPVDAYDAFAGHYRSYAERRRHYLEAVNRIIISRALHAESLLDVGAGDGSRALEIAECAGISRVVLLEPSAGMRSLRAVGVELWPFSIQQIPDTASSFEIITCLWNVLGHVQGSEARLDALVRLRRILAPGGKLFLDVSHRYNASAYGWCKTAVRLLHDSLLSSQTSGDVIVSWNGDGKVIRTTGHVFTHTEMKKLFLAADLKPVTRWVIDYETGAGHRLPFRGHFLYQLTSE